MNLRRSSGLALEVQCGLSASHVTRNIESAAGFVKRIRAGIVAGVSATAEAECRVPFGGMKESGSTDADLLT
jgi:acyl-CoA reductase-like NAD-dependent aldehyde dehydrogenase